MFINAMPGLCNTEYVEYQSEKVLLVLQSCVLFRSFCGDAFDFTARAHSGLAREHGLSLEAVFRLALYVLYGQFVKAALHLQLFLLAVPSCEVDLVEQIIVLLSDL